MDTSSLKKFAQSARRQLLEQVAARMEQVLRTDSVEIREKAKVVEELKKQIGASSKKAVIDRVAYTWFNRFCALRFMDVNHYTRIGVVSPVEGHTQPEVLAEAKQGVIDESFKLDRARVLGLLNGQYPSSNPQQEAYRLLLVGACNAWHVQMPFLFPEIEDYTELLMPDDLLSENSVLQGVRETLTPAACQDVEVIGWLYQYYISERKDEVFAALKQNQKIEAGDIPAATQLFTPHWIVRYLVENSLGRLWMLNHPDSKLVEAMDYYIRSEQEETDFLKIGSPEEIKLADPACGSGHMLTYAFDLLYAIYEEGGYDPVQIPSLILRHNLYGIEIDERAGDLAAFALVMKARSKDRRFFSRKVEPNICVLENIRFSPSELDAYKQKVGHDLFTQDLWFLLGQFEQADNFGSLIRPRVKRPEQLLERLEELGAFDDLLLFSTNEKVKQALKQAEYLSPRYHVVVANPPYMGSGGMNADLKEFTKDHFPDCKADLGIGFIDRNLDLVRISGIVGMITMQSWMFLSAYENFRERVLDKETIISLAHLGARAFDTIGGEVVSTVAFLIQLSKTPDKNGLYIRLVDGNDEAEKAEMLRSCLPIISGSLPPLCNLVSANDFRKIPGSPIAYWISQNIRDSFGKFPALSTYAETRIGLITGDNEHYIRNWYEVSFQKIGLGFSKEKAKVSGRKWFPQSKGGHFRKWYGNHETILDWSNDGHELQTRMHSSGARVLAHNFNLDKIFLSGITWTKISSGDFAARLQPQGFLFNDASANAFPKLEQFTFPLLAFLSSKLPSKLLEAVNPTLNFLPGNISSLPLVPSIVESDELSNLVEMIVEKSKKDWDSYEISWDFINLPLLEVQHKTDTLTKTYKILRSFWEETVSEVQNLEEQNNRIILDAYGLQDDLTPDVHLGEITLSCNPFYRYSDKKSEEELEALLLEDTMKEFISYAVGCMFGRYSLDKPGLILANQGEGVDDYKRQIAAYRATADGGQQTAVGGPRLAVDAPLTFEPDSDNVIPILEGEWFADDIAERFKQFLKITFGTEHYEENLAFLENAIGKDIRSYFVRDFYNEHVKMYKKRPIYWLFSSPNGSFNALVYMHRYRPDTVSVILNNYLRQYREKLNAHKFHQEAIARNPGASQGEKTKALKEVDWVNKVLSELKEYEDEILYPLATQQVKIDLDDGVKVNYGKFGSALKEVKGL